MSDLINLAGILLNISFSVGIIQINKFLYNSSGVPTMTLPSIHIIVTCLGLHLCKHFQACQHQHVPISKMIPMAFSFCGFVALTNYSLQFNSIGTYQCLKVLTTPGVILIGKFYYNSTYSTSVKLTIVINRQPTSCLDSHLNNKLNIKKRFRLLLVST